MLATAALKSMGVQHPENNQVMIRCGSIGTILISKTPFSEMDLNRIEEICQRLSFLIVYGPRGCSDPVYQSIVFGPSRDKFVADFPINISAPTDDNPFFFHMLRLSGIFKKSTWDMGCNYKAVAVLGSLTLIVTALSLVCILIPLMAEVRSQVRTDSVPFLIFFTGIGFGFMFVEISQLQRFTIFLGHPSYSLSVVLFSLLLFSGLGSYTTWNMPLSRSVSPFMIRFALLLGALSLIRDFFCSSGY